MSLESIRSEIAILSDALSRVATALEQERRQPVYLAGEADVTGNPRDGTRSPARAMTWVRALNERIYNLPSDHPAGYDDLKRVFPGALAQWYAAATEAARAEARRKLVELRDRLVEHFDIPADGRRIL